MLRFNPNSFKIKDLVINIFPSKVKDTLSYCTQHNPTVDTCGRLSPFVIPDLTTRIRVIDKMDIRRLDRNTFNEMALDVGKAVLGNQIAALCAEDMATCDAHPHLSPFATLPVLDAGDLIEAKAQLKSALKTIDGLENALEKRTKENMDDIRSILDKAIS